MTIDELTEYLKTHDNYIAVSHDGPDADGLASAYALTIGLSSIGKKAIPAVSGKIPNKFWYIDQRDTFHSLSNTVELPFAEADATLIVVDTNDLSHLGKPVERLLSIARGVIVIDHHEKDGRVRKFEYIDSSAASTSELVHTIFKKMEIALPLDALEALFAGIVYDTGSFAWPKTDIRTFACAMELLEKGVFPYKIHTRMFESASPGVLMLKKAVFATLELFDGGRIAVQSMGKIDLENSGASYEDAEDLVNTPLMERNVEISVLFKENLDGKMRCSLRTKGQINAAKIAQIFGGGGHKTSSGFRVVGDISLTKKKLLTAINEALPTLQII